MTENPSNAEQPLTTEKPRRRRKFQFSLRSLLIFVVVCAIWCGGMLTRTGVISEWGGGFGAASGKEQPSYFAAARNSLDKWLHSQGFSKMGEYPEWFWETTSDSGDVAYVGNAEGSTPLYVVVRSSRNSISAKAGFHAVVRGEFARARQEKDEYRNLVDRLDEWWEKYQVLNGTP